MDARPDPAERKAARRLRSRRLRPPPSPRRALRRRSRCGRGHAVHGARRPRSHPRNPDRRDRAHRLCRQATLVVFSRSLRRRTGRTRAPRRAARRDRGRARAVRRRARAPPRRSVSGRDLAAAVAPDVGLGDPLAHRRGPRRPRGRSPRDAGRRRARRSRRFRERRPRALPSSALFHGGLVPGPDRDPRDPAGRLRGDGPALLRREGVHAHPASARGSRRRGPHRALGRPVLAGLRGESRVRRPPRLRAQERSGPDARRVQGLARRGPHAGRARGRRDQGRRRRRSGARPVGRRDHRPRAGLGGRPEREVPDLHGDSWTPR